MLLDASYVQILSRIMCFLSYNVYLAEVLAEIHKQAMLSYFAFDKIVYRQYML